MVINDCCIRLSGVFIEQNAADRCFPHTNKPFNFQKYFLISRQDILSLQLFFKSSEFFYPTSPGSIAKNLRICLNPAALPRPLSPFWWPYERLFGFVLPVQGVSSPLVAKLQPADTGYERKNSETTGETTWMWRRDVLNGLRALGAQNVISTAAGTPPHVVYWLIVVCEPQTGSLKHKLGVSHVAVDGKRNFYIPRKRMSQPSMQTHWNFLSLSALSVYSSARTPYPTITWWPHWGAHPFLSFRL